ncbi:divergent PAP2 family protein [Proteocatella sphenisci]|uniref:divergent PAP2 family protein n=1 Tax=Proteocatella sphenisci TaxID=181070 RepID=UPI00049084ED|nr:divergent PAP2 family protein [Proteocatella sphenisci]
MGINGIFSNDVLKVTFWGWFIAQLLKVIFTLISTKKVDFSRFVGSGGMPSSHSSLVTSMTTAVGITEGFNSPIFALAFAVTCITMYDAAGVRYAVGAQAKILNQMLTDIQEHKFTFKEEKLKELIGHTPKEVIAGGILGVLIAVIML